MSSPNMLTESTRNPTRRPYGPPDARYYYGASFCKNVMKRFDELEVSSDDDGDGDVNDGINFDVYDDIHVEVTGSDLLDPINDFSEVDLGKVLNENITVRCKFVKPTPIQKHALPICLSGRDLIACAQTGSGKTAAFCFPIIYGVLKLNSENPVGSGRMNAACPSALILSPTRELSCQIHEEAQKFAYNTGVKIVVIHGGAPINQQFRNLEKGVDILVATPGRLLNMLERGKVSLEMVKYLALDEADRMLDIGFEHQIRKIVQQMDMPPPGQRQTMLFGATFPHEIERLASDLLSDYIFLTFGRVGSSIDLIAQRVELVHDMDKRNRLTVLLRDQKSIGTPGKPALTLVFVETKKGADALAHWLSLNGYPAIAIHSGKAQMERERALKSFKSGATPILVATDVASRGLDIPHVSHVINFDMPKDIDDYVHRIGRTGRAGKSGMATSFFSDKNMSIALGLARLLMEANQNAPSWLSQYVKDIPYNSYYNPSDYGGPVPVMDAHAAPSVAYGEVSASGNCYGVPSMDAVAVVQDPSVAPQGYAYGHEGVVATGWD